MSITSDLIRGHTETIILARLMISDSYGYEINKAILLVSGNAYELKEATLYTAFKRLEETGCICSYWGDESTGARRKYYSITAVGKRNFEKQLSEWEEAKTVIDKLIEVPEISAARTVTERND